MSEDFNWLDYAEPEESAPEPPRRRRRFAPRLPRLPQLRRPARPRLPRLPSLPALRRRSALPPAQRSATDLISDQAERPLDELDERLQLLRERSVDSAQGAATPQPALYDVDEVLATPEVARKPGGIISAVALSKAQERQVELLKDIVGGAQADEGGDRRVKPSRALFSLGAAPRILASVMLFLVAALPFASSDFSQGDLPPADFPAERSGPAAVYNALDTLSRGEYALVALEYGPTAAGELDAFAELVLRQLFARGAKPLIVSSNPIAIARAQNIIRRLAPAEASAAGGLRAGLDYHILRYLPGGSLGLRELSENFGAVARVSHKGALTGLELDSLDDLAAIALIAERADDLRNWAEQVATELRQTRLLAFTGYSAAPLAQVYADSADAIAGVIIGYRDAFTYGEKLQREFSTVNPAPTQPTVIPTATATTPVYDEPTATVAPSMTVPALVTDLPPPTPEPPLADTTPISDLPPATVDPGLRATDPSAESGQAQAERPLASATPLPSATATLATMRIVEVISPREVRIRRGPTTVDDILRLARAGDRFEALGANADASWYKIALGDGLEGWIAEFLVEAKTVTVAEFVASQAEASARLPDENYHLRWDFIVSLGKNRPRIYQAPAPPASDSAAFVLNRDRSAEIPRLAAMTLGTIAAALVIALGNVFYAFGALRSRRRVSNDG